MDMIRWRGLLQLAQQKLFFFQWIQRLFFFLSHPRLKRQVWSVKIACSIWHFKICFLLAPYKEELAPGLACDLVPQPKLSVVRWMPRTDRTVGNLLHLLGSICPTRSRLCWFPWDCYRSQRRHMHGFEKWCKFFYLHELYLSKLKLGLERYLYYG